MGTMTKWPVQKHTEHHKTQELQVARYMYCICNKCIYSNSKMLSAIRFCNGTVTNHVTQCFVNAGQFVLNTHVSL